MNKKLLVKRSKDITIKGGLTEILTFTLKRQLKTTEEIENMRKETVKGQLKNNGFVLEDFNWEY